MSPPYHRLIQSARPLLYLPCYERVNTDAARDLSGNGRHCAYTSASAWTLGTPGPAGWPDAAAFDGNDRIVYTTVLAALNPSVVTAEAWGYVTSLAATRCLFSNWFNASTSPRAWTLNLQSDATVGFSIGNTAGNVYRSASGGTVPLNTWVHAVGTYDGTDVIAYLNGAEVGRNTTAATGTRTTGATNVNVGSYQGGGSWLVGRACRAALYDRALSPAEIRHHYRAGLS